MVEIGNELKIAQVPYSNSIDIEVTGYSVGTIYSKEYIVDKLSVYA